MAELARSRPDQPPSRLRRLARAILTGVAVSIPVAALGYSAHTSLGPVNAFDRDVVSAATEFTRAHPAFHQALTIWQEAFIPRWVYLVATGVCVWVWRARRLTGRALWAFVTMMVCWNLALNVKVLVARDRPSGLEDLVQAPGYSFPSGHATNTAAAATALVILLWPILRRTGRRVAVLVAAAVVLITALDRVFIGAHYPSDVTAGMILGAGLVFSSSLGYTGWSAVTQTSSQPERSSP